MPRRPPPRPWPVALLIGLASEILFAVRLAVPHKLVFDEIHYATAARILWSLDRVANPEHPLLGKALIGLGIAIFGDTSVGWRAMSTLAATGVVMGVFAILWLLYGRMRTATVGAGIAALNFTVFVQARVAMLDGFMACFVVLALTSMVWAMRGQGAQVWRRWALGAVLLGLAAGTKWTAVPYVGFAAIGFAIARRGAPGRWPGMGLIGGWAVLGGVSLATYCLTFAPAFFYAHDPLTLAGFVPWQRYMYSLQTQVLPPHTYQAAWYTWPIEARPIWYCYEVVDGAQRGILMIGNPAVLWGGLAAVAACVWAWTRGDRRAGALAAVWAASWLMWAAIPKSLGFFYYYYLSSIWLALVIAAAFDHWRVRLRYWDEAYLVLVAVLFVHFYPILAATALAGPHVFTRWMWFRSWI